MEASSIVELTNALLNAVTALVVAYVGRELRSLLKVQRELRDAVKEYTE